MRHERLQTRKPYGMGLQVPSGMDDEISVPGIGRRYWSKMQRNATRNSDEQGNAYLCGVNKPGSCAYVGRDTAAIIGITGSATSEREEFA